MWSDRRWPAAILAMSLLANIFLVGVATGHISVAKRGPAARPGQGAAGWVRSSKLPPEDKHAFSDVMRSFRATIEAKRFALRNAKTTLRDAIAEPTYDRSRVGAAFAEVRRASVESQEVTQAALVEALATLSPSARASLLPAR
jgi:uncharacterized membrane protein